MDELRIKLLTLLKEIDYICKKYDITYYAEGGTVIGALRHEGFIPWDDDIDLVITRDNFNKFVKAFEKEKIPNRILEYPEKNKEYPVVTVKYTDTLSTSIFKSLFLDICAGGVNIDFFILDPIPIGREQWFKKNFLAYAELLCPYYIINDNDSSSFKYRIDLLKSKIYGKEKVLNDYRKKLFCYNEEGNNEYLIRFGITYQTVNIDYYSEPRYVKFEDMLIPIPKNAEQILSDFFGDDWYIIPEVQNQVTHNVVQNFNCSYKFYKNDYMRFVKKKEFIEKVSKLKKMRMDKKNREVYNTKHICKLNSYKDILILKNKISIDDVKRLYDSREYLKLKEYSDLYFEFQNKSIYKKNDILLDWDDDSCYYFLMNAILIGKYYQSAYIIDLFIKKNRDKFTEIYDLIERLRKAKSLYFENKYDMALEIINQLLKENKVNSSAYKIKLDIILKEYDLNLNYDIELKTIDEIYNYTNDIELIKYKGDIYWLLNEKDKAIEYYNEFKENSNNGLLLLEINKKMN